jgi:phosphonate transport system substrate-binding protein
LSPKRRFRTTLALLGLSVLVLGLGLTAGCRKGPDRLVLGIVAPSPSTSPGGLPREHSEKLSLAIADALATETRIEVFPFSTAAELIRALGAGHADIAICSAYAYVATHDASGAQVLFKTTIEGRDGTWSDIVALAAGGPRSLEELKGKTIAFSDPASLWGYLFPAAFLADNGVLTPQDLGRAVFLGDEQAALRAVLEGRVAATACSRETLALLTHNVPNAEARLAVIASTPPVPGTTVVVRAGLDSDLVDKIKVAIATAVSGGDGWKAWRAITGTDGVVEATDSDYDAIRTMAATLGLDIAVLAEQ